MRCKLVLVVFISHVWWFFKINQNVKSARISLIITYHSGSKSATQIFLWGEQVQFVWERFQNHMAANSTVLSESPDFKGWDGRALPRCVCVCVCWTGLDPNCPEI